MKPYYEEAGITIYHGDCREILPHVPKVDLVLTDPPYGINKSSVKGDYISDFNDDSEYIKTVCVPIIKQCIERFNAVILTPGIKHLFLYPPPDSFGVMYYPNSPAFQAWGTADINPLLYYGKMRKKGWCSFMTTEVSKKYGHPCSKPIKAWSKIVGRFSDFGETILDPFMGSGTTLVAAKQLGRKAIGIEIEEKYCEIAVQRLAQGVLPLETPQVQNITSPLDNQCEIEDNEA